MGHGPAGRDCELAVSRRSLKGADCALSLTPQPLRDSPTPHNMSTLFAALSGLANATASAPVANAHELPSEEMSIGVPPAMDGQAMAAVPLKVQLAS